MDLDLIIRNKTRYMQSAELIKFLLMPFVCFWTYGFPDGLGLVELLSGFAVPAFYVICGYFLLKDNEDRSDRLKWAMIRYGIFFAVLLIFYTVVNFVNPIYRAEIDMSMFRSKRLWFNFFVLDVWPLPICNSIWFIQSLFVSSVILYLADKFKLLRFYKIVLVVLFVFMLLTGELSGVIGFNVLGYQYLPGGVLTRALPYLLLGALLREKNVFLMNKPFWIYLILFVVGGALTVGEYYLLFITGKLVFISHMAGYALMDVAVIGLMVNIRIPVNPITRYGGFIAKIIYAIHFPVYSFALLCVLMFMPKYLEPFTAYTGIVVFVICLVIAILASFILGTVMYIRRERANNIKRSV